MTHDLSPLASFTLVIAGLLVAPIALHYLLEALDAAVASYQSRHWRRTRWGR